MSTIVFTVTRFPLAFAGSHAIEKYPFASWLSKECLVRKKEKVHFSFKALTNTILQFSGCIKNIIYSICLTILYLSIKVDKTFKSFNVDRTSRKWFINCIYILWEWKELMAKICCSRLIEEWISWQSKASKSFSFKKYYLFSSWCVIVDNFLCRIFSLT